MSCLQAIFSVCISHHILFYPLHTYTYSAKVTVGYSLPLSTLPPHTHTLSIPLHFSLLLLLSVLEYPPPYHSLLQNTRTLTGPSNQRELAVGPNAHVHLFIGLAFIAHLHCCKHCVLSYRWRSYSYLNEVPVEWILHTDHLVDSFKFLVKNFALLEVNLGDFFFRALRAYRGPESQGLVLCKTGDSVRYKEWMSIHTRFSFLKEEVK